jgi:hypothetical protein
MSCNSQKITLIGCGSVGSLIADTLARVGCSITSLVDKDVVEAKNRTKSIYTNRDVGKHKVDVLKDHLTSIQLADVDTKKHFFEELSVEDKKDLIVDSDVVLEMADSRTCSEACVAALQEHYEETGEAKLLFKMICLDNIAAGFTMMWMPGQEMPCPVCLFRSTPLMNTSDEREQENNEDYSMDKYAGSSISGVLPDLLFGLSMTTSLIHGVLQELSGGNSGRRNIIAMLTSQNDRNIVTWSPFRDPWFDWQIESKASLMGSAHSLSLNTGSVCPYCKLNVDITSVEEDAVLDV